MDAKTLELRLRPEWDAVAPVWRTCRGMLEKCGLPPDESDSLAMVAQELLENAVKYGAPGAEEIVLSLRVEERGVVVEVKSRVGGDESNVRAFGGAMQRIRDSSDSFGAYVERLQQAARRPYSGGSELGLARIAYEGRCALEFRVDSGYLAVSAVYKR
ncbi:MAG TPA: ATP-binding protein [Anaeromyxobacter sp.]|nr:ATP-binding protein [Anaeromyxobacter sp.]